jgi:succinyl-diaminopimelate desuccinylase
VSRLDDAFALVSISSVSQNEAGLASYVEQQLRAAPFLDVERVGDNVVARTRGHHASRMLVAGHLDTVPGDAANAVIVGDELRGVGACDMKGSLAIMVALAVDPTPRSVEVTWVFYAREEISRSQSGLLEIAELRPDLLDGDVAILCEPTNAVVEAGCQGTLKVGVTLKGRRAHTARPYTGLNAIHRLGALIDRISAYRPRTVSLDGVDYIEQLQAVAVEGGVASNVVPDSAIITLNHRVAPDRSKDEAAKWLREYLGDIIEEGDTFEVLDWAPNAPPSLDNDRLAELVRLTDKAPVGKVGWTDVATFQELNIPATNFGAGDPLLAHRSDEYVSLRQLEEFESVFRAWLA